MSEQTQKENMEAIIWLFETKPNLETALQHPLVKESFVVKVLSNDQYAADQKVALICKWADMGRASINDLLALAFTYFVEVNFKLKPFHNSLLTQKHRPLISEILLKTSDKQYFMARKHLRTLDFGLWAFLFNAHFYNSGLSSSKCFWSLARYSPKVLSLFDSKKLWESVINAYRSRVYYNLTQDSVFIANGLEYFANASEEDAKEIAALIPLEFNKMACERSPGWKTAIEKFMDNSKTVKTLL